MIHTRKILHILSQQPGKTGSGVYLQAMVRHAGYRHYRQRVVCGLPGSSPLPDITGINSESLFPVRFETPDLPFPVAGMSDIMPYVSTRFSEFTPDMLTGYLRAFERAIRAATDGFHPDVIHTHHLWLVSALARRMFPDIPIVTSCHGTEFRQLERAPHLVSHVIPDCSRIDRILALHQPQVEQLHEVYEIPRERITEIGIGFRDDIFCCDAKNTCRPDDSGIIRMTYAGKISRPKGVPWLIEALSLVEIPAGYFLHVNLAGSSGDPSFAEIPRSIDRPDCRLEFKGALTQDELASVLRSSQIFVLPSLFEGLPLVLLEAMACGCRVVTTDLPGLETWIPREIRRSGIVERVELPGLIRMDEPLPSDIPRFVQNLAKAINRQVIACIHGNLDWKSCVLPEIQPFSWNHIFDQIEEIYESAIIYGTKNSFSIR